MTYHSDTDDFDDLNMVGKYALSYCPTHGPIREAMQRRITRLENALKELENRRALDSQSERKEYSKE